MERRVATLSESADRQEATAALASEPQWILVNIDRHPAWIMPAADLARHLAEHEPEELLPLGDIPAQRREITAIDFTATLMEAQEALERDKADAAYVVRRTIPGIERVYGILTREDIERSYRIE
jgi:CBS domain-containing protein